MKPAPGREEPRKAAWIIGVETMKAAMPATKTPAFLPSSSMSALAVGPSVSSL